MIVITGAAGFIGSCLVSHLNADGADNLLLVDDFSIKAKQPNLHSKRYISCVHRDDFFHWLEENGQKVSFIFHLGARTDTTEFNKSIFNELNFNYSKKIFDYCIQFQIPMIYASSAATYGDGKLGYSDNISVTDRLKPLNPYGESKNEFDKYVFHSENQPPYWAGMKFFNVFGPNEYHKGRMASVVFHAYHQVISSGKIRLFRSNSPDFMDGEQMRDFIYVKDVVRILKYFMDHRPSGGIFNIGTGLARTYNELARSVFQSLEIRENIEYFDMPVDIRDKYQNVTLADIHKLRSEGYQAPFYSLENAIHEYVKNFLSAGKYM